MKTYTVEFKFDIFEEMDIPQVLEDIKKYLPPIMGNEFIEMSEIYGISIKEEG